MGLEIQSLGQEITFRTEREAFIPLPLPGRAEAQAREDAPPPPAITDEGIKLWMYVAGAAGIVGIVYLATRK